MQEIKGFIFDLDGVIVDTRPYHYRAWQRLASELGFEMTEQHNEELRGLSRMGSLEKIIEWGGLYVTEAEKLHWADVKNNWYVNLIAQMQPDEVLPGVLSLLKNLQNHGYKTAVVSSSKNTHAVLRSTELEPLFDAVIDGNFSKKSKPHPDCFLLAASALQLEPAECLVFEDAPVGVKAAKIGGFTTIAVGEHAEICDADVVVDGFESLTIETILSDYHLFVTSNEHLV